MYFFRYVIKTFLVFITALKEVLPCQLEHVQRKNLYKSYCNNASQLIPNSSSFVPQVVVESIF